MSLDYIDFCMIIGCLIVVFLYSSEYDMTDLRIRYIAEEAFDDAAG